MLGDGQTDKQTDRHTDRQQVGKSAVVLIAPKCTSESTDKSEEVEGSGR